MKMFWQERDLSCLPTPRLGPHTGRLVTDLACALAPSLPPLHSLPNLSLQKVHHETSPLFLPIGCCEWQ